MNEICVHFYCHGGHFEMMQIIYLPGVLFLGDFFSGDINDPRNKLKSKKLLLQFFGGIS